MWYKWFTLLLVSCALVQAEDGGYAGPVTEGTGQVTVVTGPVSDVTGPVGEVTDRGRKADRDDLIRTSAANPVTGDIISQVGDASDTHLENDAVNTDVTEIPGPVATTRAPPRTLDRQAAELAWRSWLQSPESGNPNGPARRITTKSLFITPLICPKGQRLDRNGCVQTVTLNKDEHERILLDQLNALFMNSTPSNNAEDLYDYGEEEPGPLQLTIPIGLDPQSHQNIDKKGENGMLNDASIEAELELLKLQQQNMRQNDTAVDNTNILSHNVLNNLLTYSDKPKRDSPIQNSTESQETTDKGQKEEVFGQVNVDPVLYDTDIQNEEPAASNDPVKDNGSVNGTNTETLNKNQTNADQSESLSSLTVKNADTTKLNPENDYSDIGEAIKLISRYAEVSTDDNFPKDVVRDPVEDSVLGTRTKLQYRRNRPKVSNNLSDIPSFNQPEVTKEAILAESLRGRPGVYYRYPNDNFAPPPNYPFKRLQDYWPGRNQIGGVYNNMHENPKRHHHSYPHYFRPRGYPGLPDPYSGLYPAYQLYPHKVQQNASPIRSHPNDQDMYSLLGLRHWFSSEGASKR
ncbi:unnamed protein product [Pieris macdunnoughi]|uniref:Folded gastrulation N-terminal domain-containing protein n=1 Tax=Pieris macdunnoughi TaxID=345717 RepID=A0A821RQB5_9NEOP|nr:unnamed protein product [Pieris macdunnoughi]